MGLHCKLRYMVVLKYLTPPPLVGVRYDHCRFHWPIGYHRYENNCTEHSVGYRLDTYVIVLQRIRQRSDSSVNGAKSAKLISY
jgi:hypothetical protein